MVCAAKHELSVVCNVDSVYITHFKLRIKTQHRISKNLHVKLVN